MLSRDFYIDDEQRRVLKIVRDFWQAHFNFLRAQRIREIYTSLGALHINSDLPILRRTNFAEINVYYKY